MARRSRVPLRRFTLGAALAASAVSAALCAALFVTAVLTAPGQQVDVAGLALLAAPEPAAAGVARLVRALLPGLVACGLVGALVSAARREPRPVLAAAASLPLVALALATALRDLVLTRPYLGANGYLENTFPSAHTATLAAACVAVAILLRDRARPWQTAALASCVLLTAWANVASSAHRPSDVLGGILLAGVLAPWVVLLAHRLPPASPQPLPESTNRK
ncbi:phosphatase PAP2 family protein [Isoptericola sp. NPDC057653]|uniref:phosphatase PAP2 family protein n=1 Tax=unclassified Isoptericola TaxID=2623355 RepID=UPI0036A4A0E7